MKKIVIGILMALAISVSAQAAEYSVSPSAGVRFYDEFDAATQVGVNFGAEKVSFLPENVVVSTGLNVASTEAEGKFAEVDFYTVPVDAGYKFQLDEKLAITPYGGVDFIVADAQGKVDANNTIGGHIGTNVSYTFAKHWDANVNVAYNFADVDINGRSYSMNGADITAGASYKF